MRRQVSASPKSKSARAKMRERESQGNGYGCGRFRHQGSAVPVRIQSSAIFYSLSSVLK